MKQSFLILALSNLLLMSLTAVLGLIVAGEAGFERHFLLGVLTAMYTCFVHIVTYMYFVVQEKIIRQAALMAGLDAGFHEVVMKMKSRALRIGMVGIASILLVVALGAAIGIYVPPAAHLLAAFSAIGVQLLVNFFQYALLNEYIRVQHRAFPEG